MRVPSLVDHGDVPVDVGRDFFQRLTRRVPEENAPGGKFGDISVVQVDHVLGVGKDGGDIGRAEGFPLRGGSHHEGRPFSEAVDLSRGFPGHDHEGKGSVQPGVEFHEGLHHVSPGAVEPREQLGHHFGVRFGLVFAAGPFFQFPADFPVVFHNAVMDEHEARREVGMGMGVHFRDSAMGGPPGVADALASGNGVVFQDFLEVSDLPHALDDMKFRSIHKGDTRRVVAPVFKTPHSIDQNVLDVPSADIPYYSAHIPNTALIRSTKTAFTFVAEIAFRFCMKALRAGFRGPGGIRRIFDTPPSSSAGVSPGAGA